MAFGSADGPGFKTRVPPKYPFLARRRDQQGLVTLRLRIDEGGNLREVAVIQSAGEVLDTAALESVRASTYRPAVINGAAVACSAILGIRFKLEEN